VRLTRLAPALLCAVLAAPALAAADAARPQVLVVGDSLAVGTKPYLPGLLGESDITWDAKTGRTTPQGMQVLRAALRTVAPQTVVLSLGSNDGSDPARFADRLHRTLAAIPPGACIVWASVIRPPRKGAYLGLNRVLRDAAAHDIRLTIVNWDQAVARGSVVLPDGLHPNRAGYRYRSRLIARAVHRGCGVSGAVAAP
jgi:lysophospholipase L1-like esterase